MYWVYDETEFSSIWYLHYSEREYMLGKSKANKALASIDRLIPPTPCDLDIYLGYLDAKRVEEITDSSLYMTMSSKDWDTEIDEVKKYVEAFYADYTPPKRHWLNALLPAEKDALLECFSIGYCMGASTPVEAYAMAERFAYDPYIHADNTTAKEAVSTLRNALCIFLPTTAPGYEEVTTEDALLDYIDEAYKGENAHFENFRCVSGKAYRNTEVFKRNLEVVRDQDLLVSYRLLINSSINGENRFRPMLYTFLDKPPHYLLNEVCLSPEELEQVELLRKQKENAGKESEDGD